MGFNFDLRSATMARAGTEIEFEPTFFIFGTCRPGSEIKHQQLAMSSFTYLRSATVANTATFAMKARYRLLSFLWRRVLKGGKLLCSVTQHGSNRDGTLALVVESPTPDCHQRSA